MTNVQEESRSRVAILISGPETRQDFSKPEHLSILIDLPLLYTDEGTLQCRLTEKNLMDTVEMCLTSVGALTEVRSELWKQLGASRFAKFLCVRTCVYSTASERGEILGSTISEVLTRDSANMVVVRPDFRGSKLPAVWFRKYERFSSSAQADGGVMHLARFAIHDGRLSVYIPEDDFYADPFSADLAVDDNSGRNVGRVVRVLLSKGLSHDRNTQVLAFTPFHHN